MARNKFGVVITPQVYRAITALRKQKTKRDVKKALKRVYTPVKEKQSELFKKSSEKINKKVQTIHNKIFKKSADIYSQGKHKDSVTYYKKATLGELAREKDKITRQAIKRSTQLKKDAKFLARSDPVKAELNLNKARLIMAEAKRTNTLLDTKVKTIVKKNTQTLTSSAMSGLLPGALTGYIGYETYIGTEKGLQRLLNNAEDTCGKDYDKNRSKCPQSREYYQEQAKYIKEERKKVEGKPLYYKIGRGLRRGAEEFLYMEALNTLGVDASKVRKFTGITDPSKIKDYESQGVAIGTILGGVLGAAQYLSKKGAEKIKGRTRRLR